MNIDETETPNSPQRGFPEEGRLAGIDFGTVRIGIAICDPGRSISSPYENYNRRSLSKDETYFQDLVREERLVGWVVGLPIHTDGNESQKSLEAREFGQWLGRVTDLPVRYFDERFTSAFAEQILAEGGMTRKKKKKRLDMIAAQIMLTAYLESGQDHRDWGQPEQSNLSDQDPEVT